jgi:hypothetical protein
MTTCPSNPDVRVIDTGGELITVTLVYPGGVELSRKVRPDQFEGRKGQDLIASMQRTAERRGRA